jgi:CMP-N,N'-diacetyllegionaminic acid synthase
VIEGKKVLAIIPARGGSKGVPRKNIRMVAGKPLIAWTIEEAKKSRYIDYIVLSTEDKEIADIARIWGCEVPFLRPAELAKDATPGIEPVIHIIKNLHDKYDYTVLLQPTSPLRNADDIDGCFDHLRKHQAHFCVTVSEVEISPYWMYETDDSCHLIPVISDRDLSLRRQDLPTVYALNGAVYVGKTSHVMRFRTFLTNETIAYIMPKERSLDIDTELDMKICDFLLSGNIRE